MYAVIETGGKQYKVSKDDFVLVELLKGEPGDTVTLDRVLLAKEGNSIHVGTPYLEGSQVVCEVVARIRQDKVVAYKYRRRKSSKKKIGHRQNLVKLKVKEITVKEG